MFFGDSWGNVPQDSQLEVTLHPSGGVGLAGTHTLFRPGGVPLQGTLTSADFPLSVHIGRREQHGVKFDVFFTGAPVDVDLVARVVLPDGSVFGEESATSERLTVEDKVLTVKFFVVGEA